MKRIILLLFTILINLSAIAQTGLKDLFAKSFENVNEKTGKDRFIGQILKGKRNGMGGILTKKGIVYIGDFYRDKISGTGIMLAADGMFIENCDESIAYIGNWKEGKKSGMGKCYDIEGNLVYKGNFSDDKPVENYPSETSFETECHLSLVELENSIFLGEACDGIPNGLGVIVYPDGSLWYQLFKDGVAKGIGIYVDHSGEWETLKLDNGKAVAVSTSDYYRQIDQNRKASFWNGIVNALQEFSGAIEVFNSISSNNGNNDIIVPGSINNASSQHTTITTKSGKCKECGGSGTCTGGTKPSSRYHCHGSGKCGWCQGDGFNYAGGHLVKCNACDKGKCKYCKGTGRCASCGGSGKA